MDLHLTYNQLASLQLALTGAHSAAQALVNYTATARDIARRAGAYTDNPQWGKRGLAVGLELVALKMNNSLNLVMQVERLLEEALAANGDTVAAAAIAERARAASDSEERTYSKVRGVKRKRPSSHSKTDKTERRQ